MRRLKKINSFFRQIEKARRNFGESRTATYFRTIRLLRAQFSPKEILLWGLLNPALDDAALEHYVSKERFLKFQATQSPVDHAVLLEDKEVFYRYCEAIAFPHPETIAFLSTTSAWFTGGYQRGSEEILQDKLKKLEGCELIIKPADGVYGIGVRAFILQDKYFVESTKALSLKDLMLELSPGTRYVLQRRLFNHPAVETLTGFKTLQALRVLTALPREPGGRARIMSASIRLSGIESVVNNFDYGREGNIRAKIDIESGRIIRAVRASPTGFGLEDVDRIERTGVSLIGREMPYWVEMKDLLEIKAACFYPIRLVGWDVALTPEGPVVIEGNFWFDPAENAFGDVKEFIDRTFETT